MWQLQSHYSQNSLSQWDLMEELPGKGHIMTVILVINNHLTIPLYHITYLTPNLFALCWQTFKLPHVKSNVGITKFNLWLHPNLKYIWHLQFSITYDWKSPYNSFTFPARGKTRGRGEHKLTMATGSVKHFPLCSKWPMTRHHKSSTWTSWATGAVCLGATAAPPLLAWRRQQQQQRPFTSQVDTSQGARTICASIQSTSNAF